MDGLSGLEENLYNIRSGNGMMFFVCVGDCIL